MEILNEVGRCFLPSHEAFAFMWLLAGMAVVAAAISIERYIAIARHTDYDAESLYAKLKNLIENKTYDEAFQLCSAAGKRALPRILGAGIRKASTIPELVIDSMTEESLHMTSQLEKRLSYLVMISNAATLLGLLGTVFGLIMSFAAVGRPDIAASEKTALLAAGISAAMNSTLVGLSLSIVCVGIYAWLRSKVESSLSEIDRYAVAVVKLLNPPASVHARMSVMKSRHQEEEVADTDVTPMLNLMVMLIPLLLTSSEFVRIGAIELKLPESSQGGGGGGGGSGELQTQKLDVGIVITSKGFNLFSYFKTDTVKTVPDQPDIPLVNGEYDYITLNSKLAEIKRKALYEMLKANFGDAVPQSADLYQLYVAYTKKDLTGNTTFPDHESIKIVAEEKIKYKTVIDVMDAARGTKTPHGNATMFPNVSIAGGIVQ
jgi:biopolymer transport protein ExbB/TolQ/biopolymer transport protein ExbD